MNEPRRWLETGEVSPEVLALITNAAPVRALSDGAKRRSRRRIAGLTAVPAAAGAFFWVQHVALGAALGTVVASAAVVAPRVVSTWKARETTVAPRAPAVVDRPAKSVPVPPSDDAKAMEEEDVAPPLEPQKGALPPLREPSPEPLDLVHEARLLERARALLSSDPASAFATLERHAAEAPHGTLQLERELLEVDALVRLGRRRDAEEKARILRAHSPGSLYERRLSALLGEH